MVAKSTRSPDPNTKDLMVDLTLTSGNAVAEVIVRTRLGSDCWTSHGGDHCELD